MKYVFNKFAVEVRPEGNIERFEVVHHDPVVAVVSFDKGYVYLAQQMRPAIALPTIELPAGFIDKGETPKRAAKRELREEMGIEAKDWTKVDGFYSSPGFCTEYVHLYFATNLEHGEQYPDEDEDIAIMKWPLTNLQDAIVAVDSAKSKIGLLHLWRYLN